MNRIRQIIGFAALGILLSGCGGSGSTYSPSSSNNQTPDWQFVLAPQPAVKTSATTPQVSVPRAKRAVGNIPIIVDLGSLVPGQSVPPVAILAQALNGFTGNIAISDVAASTPDHIAAVPSVTTIAPTVAGAPFNVGFTLPANYPYPGTGVAFQGTDANSKVKQYLIAFKVVTVSGTFAPITTANNIGQTSGPLAITAVNGFNGPVTITFDRNLTGAPNGFSALPATVNVSAPNSPVTVSGTSAVTTPINFSWSSWTPGNYEVVAVLTKGTMAVRVPVQVTVIAGVNSPPGSVVTWHNDNARTGQFSQESILNQGNVGPSLFGRLFTTPLDGKVEGQPLYVPNLKVGGVTHNVVYVATVKNTVYAFDADTGGAPLWTHSIGAPVPLGQEDAGNESPDGILSTPVIDVAANTIFVCGKVLAGSPDLQLHGLDLSTGNEVAGGPVSISASIPGLINNVQFLAHNAYQRPGLLLLNGVVYIGVGGQFGDPAPDRGWIFGYSESNLANQVTVYTTTDDIKGTAMAGGSIWMSGAGLSSDGTYIYASTGNGDFDANTGGADYADSILKLQPSGTKLNVVDSFTPYNQLTLAQSDLDLGSGGPILVPSQGGSGQLIVQVSKTNEVYIPTTSSMGGFTVGHDNIHQELALGAQREYLCTPAYYNGSIYMGRGTSLAGFSIASGTLSSSAFATATTTFNGNYPPTPCVSFNGSLSGAAQAATAIVWAIEQNGANAVLHAYSASTLQELFTSNNGIDNAGTYAKFGVPAIAGGKVYVPCGNELAVYGLKATLSVRRKH